MLSFMIWCFACLIFWLSYNVNKILMAIDLLSDWNFVQSFLSDRKLISFHLYWLIKGLTFVILSGWRLIYSWFHAAVRAYWKHL